MRTLSTALAIAIVASSTMVSSHVVCGAEKLKLDAEKSAIKFTGSKPDKSKHDGGFKKFAAEVEADFETPQNSKIKIEIKTESLFSDNEKLTGHLKNPDFFNVRKYPTATFVSTKVEAEDESEVTVTGKLKMLDKEVEIKVPFKTEVSESSLKMVGKFKMDRTKWGMDYGAPDKINKDVDMVVELVFKR